MARVCATTSRSRTKSLVQIAGEPLLVRTCRMLEQSGLQEIVVVTGHCGADVCAALNGASGLGIGLRFVENAQWKLSNGISVLAATEVLGGEISATDGRSSLRPGDDLCDARRQPKSRGRWC